MTGAVLGCLVVACAFGVVTPFGSSEDSKLGSVRSGNLDYRNPRCDRTLRTALVSRCGVTDVGKANETIGQIQCSLPMSAVVMSGRLR